MFTVQIINTSYGLPSFYALTPFLKEAMIAYQAISPSY